MPKNVRLTIGDFSKYCQVTVKALRHYEKLGLLEPNEVDEWTRYRYYDVAQMQQLCSILRLKNMGFSLEEIRDLLDTGSHQPSIQQIDEKIADIEEQISQLQQRLEVLQKMSASIRQIEGMDKFTIQALPSVIVASHRRVIKRCEDFGPLCTNVIIPAIQLTGCKRTRPHYCFTIDHDKEYKDTDIDIEYCEQVDEMHEDTELIKFKRLPSIPTAVCMKCEGSYGGMRKYLRELYGYISRHGYHMVGHPRVQYVEGPTNQKDPSKWVTIIQAPVMKCDLSCGLPNETYYQ